MIDPPSGLSGSPGKPVTIQALNDGKVFLDGEYRGSWGNQPVSLRNNSWFAIQGINAAHSNHGVIDVGTGSNHNVIRRVVAWDGQGRACFGNDAVFMVYENSDNLFEDIAGWGCGRKIFGVISDTRTTVLRGFFMWNKHGWDQVGGVASTYAYNSVDNYMANTIATVDLAYGGTNSDMYEIFGKDHYGSFTKPLPFTINHTLLGNIAYTMVPQVRGNGALWAMGIGMCPNQKEQPGLIVNIYAHNLLTIRRNEGWPAQAINGLGPGIPGSCNNDNGHWTDSVGTTLSDATNTTDTGIHPLSSFNNGLMNLGASTQPSSGAWIRYRYNRDKTLSTTELWPWPMNQRIQDALVASGYDKRGLDGKGELDLTKLIFKLTGARHP
jgi:hypothetical protein